MNPLDFELARLSPAQRAARRHVDDVVRRGEVAASRRVTDLLQRAGCAADAYNEAMECVRAHARVVVHFHPDRFGIKRTTVAEALLKEGVYRNQFETGLSSGSVSAFSGGARDTWESTLFGGAYHSEGVTGSERPKYGALELVRYPDGPIPRFGSSYFVLRPSVSIRTSFTFMGSEDPRAMERLGTIGRMPSVIGALLAEMEEGGIATPPWPPFHAPTLEVPNLTVARLLHVLNELPRPRRDPPWRRLIFGSNARQDFSHAFTGLIIVLRSIGLICRGHRAVALENLALRQQLAALTRSTKRPYLRPRDRFFSILLAKSWRDWRSALLIVQPDTVVRWHRQWLRRRWTQRSRHTSAGRPRTNVAIRTLVDTMMAANPCGARHGSMVNCSSWVLASPSEPSRESSDGGGDRHHRHGELSSPITSPPPSRWTSSPCRR